MKAKVVLLGLMAFVFGWVAVSCTQRDAGKDVKTDGMDVVWKDYGAEPAVLDIERYTIANESFRTTLWTGSQLQVTLMSIPAGGEIGLELHPGTDQFLRIEDGTGKVFMGDSRDSLTYTVAVSPDSAVFVPAGKWHNIRNTSDKPLKLYSIYSPVEHPHGTVHKTFEEAEAAEHHH